MNRTLPAHKTCRHRAYRLTCQQYEQMLAEGAGKCWTCSSATKRLVIDHDHKHGLWAVRGLICQGCNSQLRPDRAAPDWATSYLANPWFRRELARLDLAAECPVETLARRVSSFDGKSWFRDPSGSWTHGFKHARRLSWRELYYEFGPWGLVIPE